MNNGFVSEVESDIKLPCGLYRTSKAIGDKVKEDSLVYYHNHGEPGPGVYLPQKWSNNKAQFSQSGITIPDPSYEKTLLPLLEEGFYRVTEPFHCCEKHCRLFEVNLLVQLGYNANGMPILFVPQFSEQGMHIPQQGTRIDDTKLRHISPLRVEMPQKEKESKSA